MKGRDEPEAVSLCLVIEVLQAKMEATGLGSVLSDFYIETFRGPGSVCSWPVWLRVN